MTSAAGSEILLLSCYELGRRPLGLAQPLGFLARRGLAARATDLAFSPLDEASVRDASFIGVSVPMHTALVLGLELLPRLRALSPKAHICFYGLYATLNAELLLSRGADSVLGGEYEEALVDRALAAAGKEGLGAGPTLAARPAPLRVKLDFPLPRREPFEGGTGYVHFDRGDGKGDGDGDGDGGHVPVGTVESTRGCLHHCRHCPIPPVYEGRFFALPLETVLADIRQLVASGVRHIDFADPDFLNGPTHALRIVRAMHAEFPELTFDFTAKVEHLLRHRARLKELADSGCAFIVTAVESLSDVVLRALDKGHDRRDVFALLAAAREAGVSLRPTFVAFTPWTTREDYHELLRFIADEGLITSVDSVQLGLRLLVPPGSLLLERPEMAPFLGPLDAERLTYRWTHPDPSMDRLQRKVMALVERGVGGSHPPRDIFDEVAALAGAPLRAPLPETPSPPAPRLTEAWFC